ncbi:MAG: sigma-70 family RNA polymerase sigma factor, partial [Alicyclobacillaceae bacterium]|nr:sigma-70 family RNA polymerase sigma factor [Alicyclobacillaceae bacterium]
YWKIGNRWDTDDLVGDIFYKAFEKFSALREHSNAKAWLMRIARNRVMDFYREKNRTEPREWVDLATAPAGATPELVEELECLEKVLAELEGEDREIVSLRYFADMKYREIGAVVGKTEEAVKMRTFRLLRKMSLWMRRCMEGENVHG